MAIGSADCDCVEFVSPRSCGIELFQPASWQHSQNNPATNSRPSHRRLAPCVSSRSICGARNENCRMSASSITENSIPYSRQMFLHINSKLARHSWTESTEFVELWSDIPSKAVNHNWTVQEQTASRNDGALMSNFVPDSKHDSSVISWDLSKHPWTASKEFVVLWSDIPSEFDTSQNQFKERRDLRDPNTGTSVSNVVTDSKLDSSVISWDLSKHPWTASKEFVVLWSDIPSEFETSPNLTANSGIIGNSCIESEDLTKVSSIAAEDSISNKNYFKCKEKNKVACCRLFSECFPFAMSFRNIFFLVMITLLSLIPFSAIFMGMIHFGTCPASLVNTHLVYMTGIAGVFLIGCHIAYYFTKEEIRKEGIRNGVKTFQIITAILLAIEMAFFYSMSPSFENSENYCDKTFYNYTFYTNIAAAGIVFLLVLREYTS